MKEEIPTHTSSVTSLRTTVLYCVPTSSKAGCVVTTTSMNVPDPKSGCCFVQELGLNVLTDKGKLVVTVLEGKRKVRLGNRQAAGKQKVPRQHEVLSV